MNHATIANAYDKTPPMSAPAIDGGGWTLLRAFGQGASDAAVSLAATKDGELFVVKSAERQDGAGGGNARAQLRREWGVMSGMSSPHVLKFLGFRSGGGKDHLLLEFAPGGSLADAARRRRRGGMEEAAARAYAADVVRGLDYLHGRRVVHGDVKGSNVVVGADGRAKLADFGCARAAGNVDDDSEPGQRQTLGGTPAFMAPEVARGEEQGPVADVWALGCTVVEMATGRALWSDAAGSVLAAVRRIGFTDAVPEVPQWMSLEAKDFLHRCFQRRASDRATAAQLLEHPFVAMTCGFKKEEVMMNQATWLSPTSVLDAALWESESEPESESDFNDDKADGMTSNTPAGRIREMACSGMPLPDWDSDQGWIQVLSSN